MRAIATLSAAAMVVSLFLPWLSVPGAGFVPWDLIRGLEPDIGTLRTLDAEPLAGLLAFLASFLLAAVFVVLAIIGRPSRILALLAGGLAIAVVVLSVTRWQKSALSLDLPGGLQVGITDAGAWQLLENLRAVMGAGAWAWAVGALLLFLAGMTELRRG